MIQNVNKYPIDEILKKDADFYYMIPKYQREYTWGYKEWSALYDDLTENNEGYFIGSIICINNGDSISPVLEVIDGQQRLTTLCLFLTAIYNLMKGYKDSGLIDEDDIDELLSLKKSLFCKKSPFKNLVLVPQIQNNNQADFAYVMFENGIIKEFSKKESFVTKRKIYLCFDYFKSRIEKDIQESENPVEYLLAIKKKVCRAMLVKIEVSSHSDAYILFESLNHRGTPLTSVDLMKNLIMARAEKASMTVDDCFERWQELMRYLTEDYATQERFFRQYYNAFKEKLNEPFRKDELRKKDPLGIVATRSNLLSIYEKLINRDLTTFLDDILKCGRIYSDLIDPEDLSDSLKASLTNLNHIQGAPSYLLLMYLFRNKKTLEIDDTTIVKVIDLLTIFFVRRNVTDTPNTRDLTRIFMEIISVFETEKVTGDAVYITIHDQLKTVCASDTLFEEFLRGDIYKSNASAARYVLCAIAESQMTRETWTNLWEQKAYERSSNKYIWTIEHIFPEGSKIPQCWVDMIAGGDRNLANEYLQQYVHKLGNLTITGYNSTLSNLSFEQKKERKNKAGKYVGYLNGLEINHDIVIKQAWTIKDITDRTNLMVKQALQMFKYPDS